MTPIKSALRAVFLAAGTILLLSSASAEISIPDIGTAGIRGITIQREQQLGAYFMRTARAQNAVMDDPVLSEYLKTVGNSLVMHAQDVRFPFEFFFTNNPQLNASAFLGGKVMVHTGLVHYAATEDEFASVLAHEISHVTQRHIARLIENETAKTPLTVAGLVGAVVMGIINPMAGMAALSTTMGMTEQNRINFTRDHEAEADRLGIDVLFRSGYNPAGMVDMFRKLAVYQGKVSPQFRLLLDHPLSQTRMAEAENRLRQYPKRANKKAVNYDLARARIDVRYMKLNLDDLYARLMANPEKRSAAYREYALALICFEKKRYEEALSHLNALPSLSGNIFIVDLMTDIDLQNKNPARAIERLRGLYHRMPRNEAVVINLGNAYLQSGRAQEAIGVLQKFSRAFPENTLALDLLTQAYSRTSNRCEAAQSRAAMLALCGAYPMAMRLYADAQNLCPNRYTREILRAKIAELSQQQRFDEEIAKSTR